MSSLLLWLACVAGSMVEQIIGEQAASDPTKGGDACHRFCARISVILTKNARLSRCCKNRAAGKGSLSRHLEVGSNRDAEVFAKAKALSADKSGSDVDLRSMSRWSNSEP